MGDSKKRSQVVTPRKRRPKAGASRRSGAMNANYFFASPALLMKIGGVLALILIAFIGYRWLVGSGTFSLHRVRVTGASAGLTAEIEQTVRKASAQTSVADLDLTSLRQKVEALPKVQAASVRRALPDELRIDVTERQPAVLVRRENGNLAWLDSEGIELGDLNSMKIGGSATLPPVARGFSEGARSPAAGADDRDRIAIYKQIEKEFGQDPGAVLDMVDEIDLTYTKDVNLRIAGTAVMVHVGSRDFRNRFETGLAVLDAARRGNEDLLRRYKVPDAASVIKNSDRINYIEAARSDRVVLSFSSPGAEKKDKQDRQETTKR
ncbi:MAG: hypothetical protein DMF61_19030 [Blastocatellia bacterium AA13]|nr:MAG: hypothetical protein DMF61_19030 [Blastocatellia bacterium AA13]